MTFELESYGKIHYYKNVIKDSLDIINILESTDEYLTDNSAIGKWSSWESSDGDYEFGKTKRENIGYTVDTPKEVLSILSKVKDYIVKVSEHYGVVHNINIGDLMPISFSKYFISKEMGPHCDNYNESISGPVISVVCYLNDNYFGGELYFKNQNIKIKPTAGSIVIFPSNAPYIHQSLKIISGVKYMCPGFWYNKV